jgi:hypothetical protein
MYKVVSQQGSSLSNERQIRIRTSSKLRSLRTATPSSYSTASAAAARMRASRSRFLFRTGVISRLAKVVGSHSGTRSPNARVSPPQSADTCRSPSASPRPPFVYLFISVDDARRSPRAGSHCCSAIGPTATARTCCRRLTPAAAAGWQFSHGALTHVHRFQRWSRRLL